VLGDQLAAVLLEEVRRALDPDLLARGRDRVGEALARAREREHRVRIRERHERRLLPARQLAHHIAHLRRPRLILLERHE
jgi:hypothetical protein